MKLYVSYKRVSTAEQGRSGLGLEAQERDIAIYLDTYLEAPYEVLGSFTDIESGGNDNRPELAKAIALAKRTGAELLVAKLDRLSRDVAFIATMLKDKRVSFRVASMPHADKFQLHIYAALAEQERDFISRRTKAALAAAKAKGKVLGGLRDTTMKRNKVVKQDAQRRATDLQGVLLPMRQAGKSLREIAAELSRLGVKTARGGEWTAAQVQRMIHRIQAE